ncbi:MAG: DUF2235 domain-containing protein [Nocardioidaceae bacterium]
MTKRLVVCCDGTWNRPDSAHITNVEKIARTISTETTPDGVQQQVIYLSGVGTSGYAADRLLGGAFGFGLFDNIRSGYRWLALNYDVGDEIFVFGFSRGAYTARSLVGMIGRVGLLTRQSLISDHLPEAVDRYRRRRPDRTSYHGASDERFRTVNGHPDTRVRFLGVFDTVGALGVPGAFRRQHQFHDVRLGTAVQCARQALAVDEHRIKFEPSLWETPPAGQGPAATAGPADRVKQVWFEGAHSDVGGGYAETGLSDTTLTWMTTEAKACGLVFDDALLAQYLGCGSSAIRHDSLTRVYQVLNVTSRIRMRVRPPQEQVFAGHDRVLGRVHALGLRLAGSTARHFLEDASDRATTQQAPGYDMAQDREWYAPDNLTAYAEQTDGFAGHQEPVATLPGDGTRDPGPH